MTCNLSLPEITLPALSDTKRFLPENQHPVVDEVIRQVKEIAESFFRENENHYYNVCKELNVNILNRVVSIVLGQDSLKSHPDAEEARERIQQILTRSLSRDPSLNPPNSEFAETQTVYLAQALLQRASPRFQKIVISFREQMDDLEKRFVDAFNQKTTIDLDVRFNNPNRRRDIIGPFVALTADGPATFPTIQIPGIYERIKLVFFDVIDSCSLFAWSTFSHEMAHQALARAPGLQEELMSYVNLSNLFPRESFFTQKKEFSFDIKGTLLKNHILASTNELLSDLLGILHQGPTALLGFVRFLQQSREGGELLTEAQAGDPHPIEYFRVLFGKAVIELLPIGKTDKKIVLDKLDTLVAPSTIAISGKVEGLVRAQTRAYSHEDAMQAARKIARQLLDQPLYAIGSISLLQMFTWGKEDEKIRKKIQSFWEKGGLSPYSIINGFYSVHVVAAALQRVIVEEEDEFVSRNLMLRELTEMALRNPNNSPSEGEIVDKDPPTSEEVDLAETEGFPDPTPNLDYPVLRSEDLEISRRIREYKAGRNSRVRPLGDSY